MKLSDFGTAKNYDGPPLLPRYDSPIGDLRYTAPELFCGFDATPSVLLVADLFSLGAILFELVTQQIFSQTTMDTSILIDMNHAFVRNVSPSDRQHEFDRMLEVITAKWSLPDLRRVGTFLPRSVVDRVTDLYRGLADIDYRRRQRVRFEWIFREIEICLTILKNEAKYREWRRRRGR